MVSRKRNAKKGMSEIQKKILVADNDPVILKLVTDLLEKEGHGVLTAQDGLSSLDILKTYKPDVIIIDLIMPNISGEKLCQIIRSMPKLRDVYIIFLSAVAAEVDINYTALGANAFIAKRPFNEMAKDLLMALEHSNNRNSDTSSKTVIGVEGVQYRGITKELLSVRRHFEKILETMSEGIIETTSAGIIVYANEAALSLIGKSAENVFASSFTELFGEDHRQWIKDFLDTGIKKLSTIEDDHPLKLNGKQVSLKILPVKDDDSKRIIILNDISDRKRMEAQLIQSRKLEAIGTLAGGVAHDFNNLLTGIQGNTSLLLLDVDNTHEHYRKLKRIEELIQSGSKLTGQLLGYARKGSYEERVIDLNKLVLETFETFGRTRKQIVINDELSQDLFAIEGDPSQIEQALLNLYVNASDAMPDGGELTLRTSNISHKEIEGKPYDPKPGKYVLLTVSDTGIGMNEETMERIFDPFFTTKEMGRGTGLGLASVYGIVKAHGGYVDVESKLGEGTTFSIYLPATENGVQETIEPAEQLIKGKGTVLLVDDEEFVVEVGIKLLEALGYTVLGARSGKEALGVYEMQKDNIALVILDVIMPGMGGRETYDRLKKINPDVKVILSSGYSIDGQTRQILERGCNGFIQKPFTLNEISKKLREILSTN
jgi:PAS domain S-box-containing protein